MLSDLPDIVASTFGGRIDNLISYIWWVVAVWFVAVEGLLLYFIIRYRKKKGVRGTWMPADTMKTNLWVLLPVLVVLVFDLVIEVKSHDVWEEVKGQVPKHEELVRITGRQFAWDFTYAGPDGVLDTLDDFQTVSELHVPKGRVIRFVLQSEDVLHSFWVPVLRLKQDVVPGREIPGWFEATQEGSFDIACAELCGAAHGAMKATLIVHSQSSFDTWERGWAEQRAQLNVQIDSEEDGSHKNP